ncbi:hypothetical protein EV182_006621, partial [Spiromyces aspiralis]
HAEHGPHVQPASRDRRRRQAGAAAVAPRGLLGRGRRRQALPAPAAAIARDPHALAVQAPADNVRHPAGPRGQHRGVRGLCARPPASAQGDRGGPAARRQRRRVPQAGPGGARQAHASASQPAGGPERHAATPGRRRETKGPRLPLYPAPGVQP